MGTRRSWVKGPWPRKLALAARPRGGDWLEDEVVDWRRSGVDAILSLLTPGEERDFGLEQEGPQAKAQATEFTSFPIADRQVPVWRRERPNCWTGSTRSSRRGRTVIHCRQGVGRSGLVAACLPVARRLDSQTVVETVTKARGVTDPETEEQRRWIDRYAATLTSSK